MCFQVLIQLNYTWVTPWPLGIAMVRWESWRRSVHTTSSILEVKEVGPCLSLLASAGVALLGSGERTTICWLISTEAQATGFCLGSRTFGPLLIYASCIALQGNWCVCFRSLSCELLDPGQTAGQSLGPFPRAGYQLIKDLCFIIVNQLKHLF